MNETLLIPEWIQNLFLCGLLLCRFDLKRTLTCFKVAQIPARWFQNLLETCCLSSSSSRTGNCGQWQKSLKQEDNSLILSSNLLTLYQIFALEMSLQVKKNVRIITHLFFLQRYLVIPVCELRLNYKWCLCIITKFTLPTSGGAETSTITIECYKFMPGLLNLLC